MTPPRTARPRAVTRVDRVLAQYERRTSALARFRHVLPTILLIAEEMQVRGPDVVRVDGLIWQHRDSSSEEICTTVDSILLVRSPAGDLAFRVHHCETGLVYGATIVSLGRDVEETTREFFNGLVQADRLRAMRGADLSAAPRRKNR